MHFISHYFFLFVSSFSHLYRVTGGELFHYLADKDFLSEEIAAQFTKQILEGVQHLHERDICHLDLKVGRHPSSENDFKKIKKISSNFQSETGPKCKGKHFFFKDLNSS